MNKNYGPLVTGGLFGLALWLLDSIFYAFSMVNISISGAILTEVSPIRLIVRFLILALCILMSLYISYSQAEKDIDTDEGFKADDIFNNDEYLKQTKMSAYTGDDTLRGISYIQSVSKNENVDISNRPVYYSEHIKKSIAAKTSQAVRPVKLDEAPKSQDVFAERFDVIQKNESVLLWQYCGKLGVALNLTVEELDAIRVLCYSYNLGHYADHATYENHCDLAVEIMEELPGMDIAIPLVKTHHEKWDGSGLLGLQGLDIPLGSRIFAVAWVYNSLTKPFGAWRLSNEDALEMLNMYRGTALDPELVAVFTGLMGSRVSMSLASTQRVFSR